MSPKRARWWRTIRTRGLLRFIVLRGILLWACGTFALATLLMFVIGDGQRFVAHNVNQPLITIGALVSGGILWAVSVWYFTEWEYGKFVAKNGEPSEH